MLAWIIPTTMLQLGGMLMLLAPAIQLLIPQRSKLALWFALVGGFGVGGGVGGWFGSTLVTTRDAVVSTTEKWTAGAVGAGFGGLLFGVLTIFFLRHAGRNGKGLQVKGNGKSAKAKEIAWVMGFALLGCAIAAIPTLYSHANEAVHTAGTALLDAF